MESGQTTIERFQSVSPTDFESEINRLWAAVEAVKDGIVQQVENEAVPPLTGLSMVACITGQVFGYGLFHGQPAPADLIADLSRRSALQPR